MMMGVGLRKVTPFYFRLKFKPSFSLIFLMGCADRVEMKHPRSNNSCSFALKIPIRLLPYRFYRTKQIIVCFILT